MLYKYLNPHLLAVATVRESGASSAALRSFIKKTTDPCVTVHLIDSITGTVIDKAVHRHATGPVRIVRCL